MTQQISRDTAEHYTWGQGCDGWHLVRAAGLSVIQERMLPDTSEVRHRHVHSRQFFYVLSGELQLEVDSALHTLVANTGLEIAPGQTHRVVNRSAVDAMFLVISQPPSHGDREVVRD